jgi:DNA-binding response OmpR family regulator
MAPQRTVRQVERSLRILVVEDDYLVAEDLAQALTAAGVEVVGPVPSVEQAMRLIAEHGPRLDAAVLDVNLGRHTVFPVADRLTTEGVPFVFATGYDARIIPVSYRDIPRCEKPIAVEQLLQRVGSLLEG